MSTADLEAFLDRLEAQDDPRVVVRWTDEQRILPNEQGGFTVGRIMRATLTARLDGQLAQLTVEGVPLPDLQRLIRERAVDPLYRADNITR